MSSTLLQLLLRVERSTRENARQVAQIYGNVERAVYPRDFHRPTVLVALGYYWLDD